MSNKNSKKQQITTKEKKKLKTKDKKVLIGKDLKEIETIQEDFNSRKRKLIDKLM